MNKQEQIEEMAKYICNACEMGFNIDGDCAQGNNYKTCGISKETAEYIYNAGYRKIPENAVVLTKKEYQKYCAYKIIEPQIKGCLDRERKLEQKIERLKAENERLERVINDQNELCWGCKKSVKETAKEVLILLGKGFDETKMTEFKNLPWYKLFYRELKQRYGVEVEE